MSALCPHCGYDLVGDEPITIGEMHFDPRGKVIWKGRELQVHPLKRIILHALLKAGGRYVSDEVLAERMGYEGDNPRGLVRTHRCHMKLIASDLPIERAYGRGYRWAG